MTLELAEDCTVESVMIIFNSLQDTSHIVI